MQYNQSSNCLQVMYWNCQGITTLAQQVELQRFIKLNSIDVILLNETFLKPNHKLSIPGFKVYRNDRISHGGGVAIVIRSVIKHKVENSIPTKIIENKCLSVEFCNFCVKFISAYCPRYTQDFLHDIELLTSLEGDYFITGDFNAHHTSWNCSKSDSAGTILYNHHNYSNYYIHIFST